MSITAMQTGSTSTMPWDGFYNIILAHAKLQYHTDHNTSTMVQTNAHERGCSNDAITPSPDLIFTTVSGPTMTMKANMKFQPEEWARLTPVQKSQLRAAKSLTFLPTTPRKANSTPVTRIATPIDSVLVINKVVGDSLLQQTQSNKAARTPTDSVNQLNHNSSTYQRIANHVNICYHFQSSSRQSQHGSLIDGGANGGMSG
jgi:hypothetical protein